ncbi:hypothetical protein L484_014587 [Morus notabilis]|uniref:Uncharacterized protein n=1 Tax=Morus notabilis TaxID=981085 RepID=W9S7P0_9ROSA|nr:hypothetical protein L484_014587 [Morus notabilis]
MRMQGKKKAMLPLFSFAVMIVGPTSRSTLSSAFEGSCLDYACWAFNGPNELTISVAKPYMQIQELA